MDLLRFMIDVQRVSEQEWSVSVKPVNPAHPEYPPEPAIYTRRIRRSSAGKLVFPQPPESEVESMTSNAPERILCSTTTLREIEMIYRAIIGRQPNRENKDVEAFGRYLSATLLGHDGWQAINTHVGNNPIELAIRLDASEHELARLPWEMMYRSASFLTGEPMRLVAITRLVSGATYNIDPLPLPLKVLFVVGTDLNQAQIRPGAEYLGLLRRLEAIGKLSFQSRILLSATIQDLRDEIIHWQPSVVHFICHGNNDWQGRRGYLELMNEDRRDRNPTQPIFAESLLPILMAGGSSPLVVLNTCYSGRAAAQEAVPLAVDLVKGGIPIVVGMGGRVSDKACRLFTRYFYEALLQEESVVAATAEGRRAGFIHAGDPLANVDWAFPTVFLSEGISPHIKIASHEQGYWSHLQEASRLYYTLEYPPIFCDRLVFIEAYQRLIDEKEQHTGSKVLAVEAKDLERDSKYGKSCLLQELAARAVRDGHVPCLVFNNKFGDSPDTPLALAWEIVKAIHTTCQHLQLPMKPLQSYESYKLKQLIHHPQEKVVLNSDVNEMLDLHDSPSNLEVIATAIRVDLEDLAAIARQRFSDAKVLILIDDAHHCRVEPRGQAALDLLLRLLMLNGLVRNGSPIRIVFTYSRPTEQEYLTASEILYGVTSSGPKHIEHLRLEEFGGPGDDQKDTNLCRHDEYHLVYQQFLLGHDLVVACQHSHHTEICNSEEQLYTRLHDVTEGIPSRFQYTNKGLKALLSLAVDYEVLEKANDNALLDQMKHLVYQKGGR